LYTAVDQPAAGSRFPDAPLIALPSRIAPLSDTAAGAQVDVRLERFAALFAGVDGEDVALLDVARGQSIARAIAGGRARWSEDNAAELARELAAEDSGGSYDSQSGLTW